MMRRHVLGLARVGQARGRDPDALNRGVAQGFSLHKVPYNRFSSIVEKALSTALAAFHPRKLRTSSKNSSTSSSSSSHTL